jgi:hypothetical protein
MFEGGPMMKSRMLAGIAALALFAGSPQLAGVPIVGAAPAEAQSISISFNLFYDRLQPHGVWVRHPRFNYVWCPTRVDAGWRPYTDGRWVYLDNYGWYFQSQEPFAWATYHYGRWYVDAQLGWCWVPGTRWAPAWVTWRRGGDVIGWAPLPPQGEGFSVSIEVTNVQVPDDHWFFVPAPRFVAPDLRAVIIFVDEEPDLLARTEYVGPVVVQNNIVVNNVININFIEEQTGQPVQVLQVEPAAEPAEEPTETEGTISIFTGDIEETPVADAPPDVLEPQQAATVIEEEGGTAGTAGTPNVEDSADPAAAEATTDAEDPADADAAADAEAEAAADAEADVDSATADEEAEAAADDAEGSPEAAEADADAAAAADEAEAAADEEAVDEGAAAVEESETPCPPEQLVDGVCVDPAAEPEAAADETTEQAPDAAADESAAEEPAAEQAPADEPAAAEPEAEAQPAEPEAEQPAADEAAPAEEPAAEPEEAEGAPEGAPATDEAPCPPEFLVDGVCVRPQ